MKTNHSGVFYATLLTLLTSFTLQAQLVADGETLAIDGASTNITGNLTIGSSGSFTTVIVTNAGALTNTGTSSVGFTSTSKSNRVVVTGPNSVWSMSGNLNHGVGSSHNLVVLTNGGWLACNFGNINFNAGSSNNTVMVTDTNSFWTSAGTVNIGNTGPGGLLIITNGGRITSLRGRVGNSTAASNNLAIVTGVGSLWNATANFFVGGDGSFNQLFVVDGGRLTTTDGYMSGNAATNAVGSHNLAIVSGSGSKFTISGGGSLYMGAAGSFNQLLVTNSGVMEIAGPVFIGTALGSSNNVVMVTGANSLLSNVGGGPTDIYVGQDGVNNSLIVSNAGNVVSRSLILGNLISSSNNSVVVAGGNLIVTNLPAGVADVRRGSLTLNSGLLRTDVLLATNGSQSSISFNGGLLQSRNLTNNNGQVFVIGNDNSEAILELLGNGNHRFVNGLHIANNASLKGNGSIHGNVTNASGGTLSPGESIGSLNINGSLTLANGSISAFEVNKGANTNDNVLGLTSVTLGGTLLVTNLSGPLTNGTTFKLFTATTYAGAFDNFNSPSPGAGLKWNLNRLPIDGVLRVVADPSPKPTINSISIQNDSTVLSATGGVPYDPVYLLTTTNITTPLENWTRLATNQFNISGNTGFTNGLITADPKRFYALQIQ